MSSIRQRGNSFQIRVYLGKGASGKGITKTKTVTPPFGLSKKELERWVNKQAVEFEDLARSGKLKDKISFEALGDLWLEQVRTTNELKATSLKRMEDCRERTYNAIGYIMVDEISFSSVQDFVNSLAKDGANKKTGGSLSVKTRKHYLTFISNVLRYGVYLGYLSDNICRNINVGRSNKKDVTAYSIEEEKMLKSKLENVPIKYKTFIYLLMYLGLRRSEALGLEWKDIDFTNRTLSIVRTSQYRSGYGVYADTPKTKSSQRCIVIGDTLLNLLKEYREEQTKQIKACGDNWVISDRLFTQWNGLPMNPNTPYTWLKRFCEKEHISYKGLHSFRHAFATQAIVNGKADIKSVSAVLGHSKVSTTTDIYTHAIQSANAVTVSGVADILDK